MKRLVNNLKYVQLAESEVGMQVIEKPLPKTGQLKDGRTVSGYDLLPNETLMNEGWLPLEEQKPEYDEETQLLQFGEYIIEEDKVIAVYTVIDVPQEPIGDGGIET